MLASTDWAKVTAEATIALAAITAVLAVAAIAAAWFAARGLRAASADLKATQEATVVTREMGQRQIDAAHRPLLIDVAPAGPVGGNDPLLPAYDAPRIRLDFPGGHTDDIDPRKIYVHLSGPRINIAIPLRNVGNGLAVINQRTIIVLGQRIDEIRDCLVQRPRVPPGETTRIICAPPLVQGEVADYPWGVTVAIGYDDFLGRQGAIAVVHLEQPYRESDWVLKDVEQDLPERPIP
jgi:hypothetical protein